MDHSAQAGYTGSDYFNVFTVSRPLRALFFGFFFFLSFNIISFLIKPWHIVLWLLSFTRNKDLSAMGCRQIG